MGGETWEGLVCQVLGSKVAAAPSLVPSILEATGKPRQHDRNGPGSRSAMQLLLDLSTRGATI